MRLHCFDKGSFLNVSPTFNFDIFFFLFLFIFVHFIMCWLFCVYYQYLIQPHILFMFTLKIKNLYSSYKTNYLHVNHIHIHCFICDCKLILLLYLYCILCISECSLYSMFKINENKINFEFIVSILFPSPLFVKNWK